MPKIERHERLAINLYDLDRVEPSFRQRLLAGRLDLEHPLRTDWDRKDAKDEVAVIFTCDLLPAAIICDTLRNQDRAVGDFPTRVYLKRKAWSRVPSYAILSTMLDGQCVLNPDLFYQEVPTAPPVPVRPKKVSFWSNQ